MSKIESVVRGATITDVSTRTVGAQQATIWDVYTHEGTKWSTFNAAIGNKAIALKNQVCDLKVEIVTTDKGYQNFNIVGLQATPGASPVATAMANAGAAMADKQEVSYDAYKDLRRDEEDRKNDSIHRQTATKVAAQLVLAGGDATDFWPDVFALVDFYKTGGINPSHTSPPQEDAPPTDDIPF